MKKDNNTHAKAKNNLIRDTRPSMDDIKIK